MAKQVPWNPVIVEEFILLAGLNGEEERIIRTRAAGWSRVKQSIEFNMSLATIDRMISRLKAKYDIVQKYSTILPERKFTCEDTYRSTKEF